LSGDEDYFARFIFLWISFNSWYDQFRATLVARNGGEEKYIREHEVIEFLFDYQELVNSYSRLLSQSEFHRLVEELQRMAPLNNLLKEEEVHFEDVNSFRQYLNLIYQIRNNLFHGGKSVDNARDLSLVVHAYQTLSPVFRPIVEKLSQQLYIS
jgi:hypothetical protein